MPYASTSDGIRKEVRDIASKYGVEVVGFLRLDEATVIPVDEMGLLRGVRWAHGEVDITNVKDPRDIMPGAKSMVILGKRLLDDHKDISYRISQGYTASIEFMVLDVASARVAAILKDKGFKAEEYTSYYLKVWAVLAGLGWIGKSRMFVSSVYGPRLRLKGILTDIDLGEPCKVLDDAMCGECKECINACPVNAISEKEVDRKRCGDCVLNHRKISEYAFSYCTACTASCPVGKRHTGKTIPQGTHALTNQRLTT